MGAKSERAIGINDGNGGGMKKTGEMNAKGPNRLNDFSASGVVVKAKPRYALCYAVLTTTPYSRLENGVGDGAGSLRRGLRNRNLTDWKSHTKTA